MLHMVVVTMMMMSVKCEPESAWPCQIRPHQSHSAVVQRRNVEIATLFQFSTFFRGALLLVWAGQDEGCQIRNCANQEQLLSRSKVSR